ncbi:MAG: carbamoyltransferase HypF [Lachnospiraceae bacterium]|nr:carbamoyltransferase HypF [Lachnospiraceae bacterium]
MARTGVNIKVRGIVQGVGFRPYIHRLVEEHALAGWIRNTSYGAELMLSGEADALDAFIKALPEQAPALALIEEVTVTPSEEAKNLRDFRILPSAGALRRDTLISPDVCTCPDCLRELFDPADRRYRYPFINCTNCGPRFTIIRDIPYDRANTTMAAFPMCGPCQKEYGDIRDRRYHAQPDCCPDCGPRLQYLESGKMSAGREEDPIKRAQEALRVGKILAVKGLGGYHLACRAEDASLADTLRQRKHRDEKPFALMCADVETARKICLIDPEEEALLTSAARPIVLLKKKDPASWMHISENGRIGIMLPYAPVHFLLLQGDLKCLVMTSANLSDRPILRTEEEALRELSGIADAFLIHNREIHVRCDDSVMWGYGGGYFARRSRGYVPLPITVEDGPLPAILACGAEQKATFALSRDQHVFLSQHIGDLKNIESLENYRQQIEHFERIFSIRPQALACDLHPDYLSSEYAHRRSAEDDLPLFPVQHHHAHMVSCMADNQLHGPVVGVVWDGTGLGEDGTVWGGEFLVGDENGFKRIGHIRPILLPGGDKAMKEIWRTGLSLLLDAGVPEEEALRVLSRRMSDDGERKNTGNGAIETAGDGAGKTAGDDAGKTAGDGAGELPADAAGEIALQRKYHQCAAMWARRLNCPASTGMGRLFDGISAILGICQEAGYEGQGAVLLEAAAAEDCAETYSYEILEKKTGDHTEYEFDFRPMIREITAQTTETALQAARFMNTLVEMAVEICRRIAEDTGLRRVVLSGGSFQNMYILKRLVPALQEAGLTPYTHHQVSCNDEGLSLGQLMIARAQFLKEV